MLSLPLKLVVNEKFIRKNGTCIVYVQYCYSTRHRTLLNTRIEIPPGYWDDKNSKISSELPLTYGNVSELNEKLKNMYRAAEDLVLIAVQKNIKNTGEFLKREFKPGLNPAKVHEIEKSFQTKNKSINLDL